MKTKLILFAVIALLLGGMGCEKKTLTEYYIGKVITLEINDVNLQKQLGIIEIQKSIPNGLPIGSAIVFDELSIEKDLKVGDILNFTIIKATGWLPTTGFTPYIPYTEIKLYNP